MDHLPHRAEDLATLCEIGEILNSSLELDEILSPLADRSAWIWVEAETARRTRGHADVAIGLVAPAYGPDVS